MDSIFWLGLLLGGLLGTALDLWKRPLDRLLDRRLEQRSTIRADRLARTAQQDRQYLRNYLTEVILQTTLIGSLVAILSGIAFALSSSLIWFLGGDADEHRSLFIALSLIGQGLSIAGAGYIVRMAGDALSVARAVNPSQASPGDTPGAPRAAGTG